jgi:hypothetical protein
MRKKLSKIAFRGPLVTIHKNQFPHEHVQRRVKMWRSPRTAPDKKNMSKMKVIIEGKLLRYSGMLVHEFSKIVSTLSTRKW